MVITHTLSARCRVLCIATHLKVISLLLATYALHELIVAIFGVRPDDEVVLASRALHVELPYFRGEVAAGLQYNVTT